MGSDIASVATTVTERTMVRRKVTLHFERSIESSV